MKRTITVEAIHHIPKSNYAYGYDKDTLHIRLKSKKGEVQKVFLRIGDPYIWDEGGCDGGNMSGEDGHWTGAENILMEKECESKYFDHWICKYRPPKKRSRYAFILENHNERILFTERRIHDLSKEEEKKLNNLNDFFCFPYLNYIDISKIPNWVSNTVWYQIFPDRFNSGDKNINPQGVKPWGVEPKGNDFMGGDLRGIIDKLDYLKDLGINGIYLCPIFKATQNHRYDTIDYFEIDEALGDKEVFKELVSEAHKRDMRIMLDAVFNHIGYDSLQWQDVIKNGVDSKYKDWFYISKFPVVDKEFKKLDGNNLNYEVFGRTPKMPKLNTENKEVIDYLLSVAEYWVKEMDIDGWRLDVANEVDHVFWRKFKDRVTSIKEDIFILGEIWHDAMPWLRGDQFHSVMNYPLCDAIKEYFCEGLVGKEEFQYSINNIYVSYPIQITEVVFNLLDSHDTSRVLSLAKGDKNKFKLALLFMFTQSGSPCIYYGTEIGMEGVQRNGKNYHRRCMDWNIDFKSNDIFNFTSKLIAMRHRIEEFKSYKNNWIDYGNLLAYKRGEVIVLINNSNDEINIVAPKEIRDRRCLDCFNNKGIYIEKYIHLKKYDFMVIK